jgi:preprotein translocase subunit SecG
MMTTVRLVVMLLAVVVVMLQAKANGGLSTKRREKSWCD